MTTNSINFFKWMKMKTMKKINVMTYVAIVALLALGSCTKENGGEADPGEMTTVKFQVSYEGGTSRAVANPLNTGDLLTLKAGHIFFTDGGGNIVRHVGIVEGANLTSGPGSERVSLTTVMGEEAVILNVPASVQRCYILANDVAAKIGGSTGVTGNQEGNNISTILNLTTTAPNLNSAAGDLSTVAQFGSGTIVPGAGQTAVGNVPYDAAVEVPIRALTSRIQIKKITGGVFEYKDSEDEDQQITIDNFTVEGIYINNYYSEMTVASTWPSAVVNHLQDVTKYTTAGTAPYSSTGNGYKLADAPLAQADNSLIVAPADNSKVWAYNVFPTSESAANNANVPHIIIKLSSVTFTDSGTGAQNTLTNQYLTIAKIMTQGGSATVNAFLPNNSYTFNDIVFDYSKLSPLPEATEIDVLVTVDLIKWTDNSVVWGI
jgi:hypothetical protein